MPSTSSGSSSSRKFGWLATAIVGGILLWTVGWFLFAARIIDHLPTALAEMTGANATADCVTADIRGYPFRFGVFCDAMSYANPADGVTATTGAFRSAAQFYKPGHIVAEIDGPLSFSAPGVDAHVDWQVLQASVHAAIHGLNRGSLDGRNISFDIDGIVLAQKFSLQADRITAHARRSGTDLDIAAYGELLQTSLVAGQIADKVTLEATLAGQSGLLDRPYTGPIGTVETQIHRLSIELDKSSSLEISGPVQIGSDGRLSGALQLTVRNQQRFTELAAGFDPALANSLGQFAPLLSALDTIPGDDGITLPLTLDDNMVSLGMFPLGRLPDF
ncbi:hypothetical protein IMCC20628_04559 [Hoeflea sp. IMCC20628]|uniref:DUF2125 domain-containing protein n=1 Tax=Hoeflea sp. IMCC20628 TaxID=1620421 RepID=UPI00063AD3E0|nr:DUF2125 domain-containing protein [Hoeflea sp. IMCC20628]AKI03228.1 hypothetical protein IMCC20628_04559 [Hoeflea sp. IMCC20628]